jgi:hypothetical protein
MPDRMKASMSLWSAGLLYLAATASILAVWAGGFRVPGGVFPFAVLAVLATILGTVLSVRSMWRSAGAWHWVAMASSLVGLCMCLALAGAAWWLFVLYRVMQGTA